MPRKSKTIDEYFAAWSGEKRAALERLRKIIRAAAPGAEECISYGLPAFCLGGRAFIWFGATANHCALYGGVEKAFRKELAKFDISSKGTIRFQPSHPLPATVVRKLVKSRMAKIRNRE